MSTTRPVSSKQKSVGSKQKAVGRKIGKLFSAYCLLPTAFCLFVFTILAISAPPISGQQLAVQGETVYTMAGQAIRDGVVLIREGKVEQVGAATEVKIPAGFKTVRAKVVTP